MGVEALTEVHVEDDRDPGAPLEEARTYLDR